MSIRYNEEIIAGKYKSQVIHPASESEAGIIEIATSQDVKDGTNNTKAVTPRRLKTNYATKEELNTKQDNLVSGTNIKTLNNESLLGEGNIDITSAQWGNIEGDIDNQTDLKDKLDFKQDIISDIDEIRNNAETGANLAPLVAVNTQRIEDLTTARIPDVVYHGTPKITGGQVSNFSTINYLQFPFEDISRGLPFDIYFSFTTDDDVTTQQNIIDSHFGIALAIQNSKGVMALSSNGTSWDIGSTTGVNTILPNTTYYVKYSWTGTEYNASLSTNDQSYVPDMILPSNKSPYKTTIYIGGSEGLFGPNTAHPFKGIINFSKSRVDVNGITVWEGMADVGIASRANVSLTNLDEVGEKRFTDLQDSINTKQDTITDLETIRAGASKGATAIQNTNDCVHKAGNETITGIKTFSGGKGGNDVGIISTTGMLIGGIDKTAYTQYGTVRSCDGKANTGSYYINSDGSLLFRHKTGTASAEGSVNDAMLTLHPVNGLRVGWAGEYNVSTTADKDVLVDTVEYSKLNTTAKDVLGAINELNSKPSTPELDEITISLNEESKLQAIGTIEKNKKSSIYDWVGTNQEYLEQDVATNHPEWICYITDDDIDGNQLILNNPFSLGDSKYSPTELNNTSWLKSNGQWNDGNVYKSFYEAYMNKIGESFGLGFVKTSTDTYDDYDLVINTANTQFRLPLLDGSESILGSRYVNLDLPVSGGTIVAPANGTYFLQKGATATSQNVALFVGDKDSQEIIAGNRTSPAYATNGAVSAKVKRGDILTVVYSTAGATGYFRFTYDKGNGSLYYYVGETVQNANLVDVGRIAEQLSGKVDGNKEDVMSWGLPDYSKGIVITQATSLNYTVPANGFIISLSQNSGTPRVYINDNLVWGRGSTQGVYGYSFTLPVSKNDVVKTQGLNPGESIYFFPLKGVN